MHISLHSFAHHINRKQISIEDNKVEFSLEVQVYICLSISIFSHRTHCALVVALSEKKQVPFSMDIENAHARVISKSVSHGNSKNEIRQRNKRREACVRKEVKRA